MEAKNTTEAIHPRGEGNFNFSTPGGQVRLSVTDDALTLFGFATEAERQFFLQLMTVSGIGPKLALAVLSGGRVADIQQAIRLGDFASLKRIKGIGDGTSIRAHR